MMDSAMIGRGVQNRSKPASDVLFVENARKWRFTPLNPLLEWFQARLRVSIADWDPETGCTARFIKVWTSKWWFCMHFSWESEGNPWKSMEIHENPWKSTKIDEKPPNPTKNNQKQIKSHAMPNSKPKKSQNTNLKTQKLKNAKTEKHKNLKTQKL